MAVLERENSSSTGLVRFVGRETNDSNRQEIRLQSHPVETLPPVIVIHAGEYHYYGHLKSGYSHALGNLELHPEDSPREVSWVSVFNNELHDIQHLEEGWDGYSAPPPCEDAIHSAKRFLDLLTEENLEPSHMGPSVSGGVGFTLEGEEREYVIEFLNTGIAMRTYITEISGSREVKIDAVRDEDPCDFLWSEIRNLNFV